MIGVRSLVSVFPRLLGGACSLSGTEVVVLDRAGSPVWASSTSATFPPASAAGVRDHDGSLPCLNAVSAGGLVFNPRLRSHPSCRDCPAADCRLAVLVPVPAGAEVAGGLAFVAADSQGLGAVRTEALLALAGGLGEALGERLQAAGERLAADRAAAHFELLARAVREGMLVLEQNGRVSYANPAAEALLAPWVGRVVGKPVAEVLADLPGWMTSDSGLGHARHFRTGPAAHGSGLGHPPLLEASVFHLTFRGRADGLLLLLSSGSGQEEDGRAGPRLYTFDDIKGVSATLWSVKETAARAAHTDATILIRGESGTGKEVFAQAIHGVSPRRAGPFVAVNCAAIPDTLLESELFGYDEGAFTGARKGGKPGKFELAEGGTLFLDEIGDMPLVLQAKLLRVLQERMVERVGSSRARKVNVRIIAATNRDLMELIGSGQFREDLYYRLNVIPLEIPPLRERREDLYLLIDYLLKKYGRLLGKEGKRLSAEVMGRLHAYHWPGNVRELENTTQYVVSLESGPLVTLESLPPHLREWKDEARVEPPPATAPLATPTKAPPPMARGGRHSRPPGGGPGDPRQVQAVLERFGRTTAGRRAAAAALGVSLATLYRWIKRLEKSPSTPENTRSVAGD